MSLLGLLWANLFRKRTRTTLTLLSVTVAFLLFMLLRTVALAFSGGANLAGVDRLVVSPKYSIIDSLPINQGQQILAVEGVEAVTHANWFGGQYQNPRNFFPKYPVDPASYFDLFPELEIDPDQLAAFQRTRTGAFAGEGLVERFGWKVGDVIPIQGDIWLKDDGSRLWQFELVGTFRLKDDDRKPGLFLINYNYFTEAVADYGKDQVGWWTVRLSEPDRAAEIATKIDSLFENSQDPTRTATEDERNRQFASQLGDMGFITTMIMGAVFFTIVLLTANTMTQALRERVPELAVLKTLGFSDTLVSLLVLAEAMLLCVLGAVLGIGLAFALQSIIAPTLEGFLGAMELSLTTAATAIGLSLVIGLVIGGVPALTARRLSIVDALRER